MSAAKCERCGMELKYHGETCTVGSPEAEHSLAAPPCSAIPSATEHQKRTGWTIQTNLLDDITVSVNAVWEDTISMEQTEQVILELSKRGYVVVAGSPNDKVSRPAAE